MMTIHRLLDTDYDHARLVALLDAGVDPDAPNERNGEPPLLAAVRRRRLDAVRTLVERGADVDRTGAHGKTAWAHAIRRGFFEVSDYLESVGASTALTPADRLAVAFSRGKIDEARAILAEHPGCARTGNPEEDRLLADLAGREAPEPVRLLIDAGADLAAQGLDGGTALHCAAWFGQPQNARLLIDAGAPLDVFDPCHESTPLHWAVHGSRYSGGADERQEAYVELTRMLLEAGASTVYPPGAKFTVSYEERMLCDASPAVAKVLRVHGVGS